MFSCHSYVRLFAGFILIIHWHHVTASDLNDHWTCDNHTTRIMMDWICDGEVDCWDKSDESPENCPDRQCDPDDFQCDSGMCIAQEMFCDGYFDCGIGDHKDTSDEPYNCTARWVTSRCDLQVNFLCLDELDCVSNDWVCDDHEDCIDGSDEENCTKSCYEIQIRCNNTASHSCIEPSWICDGHPQCDDGEDERNCSNKSIALSDFNVTTHKCKVDEFECGEKCVEVVKACNGESDCTNGEDEKDKFCSMTICRSRNNQLIWDDESNEILCDQRCRNTPQGPRCHCLPGFRLEPNGYKCRNNDSFIPDLLYAANNKIYSLSLSSTRPEEKLVITDRSDPNTEIVSTDFDVRTGAIMWAATRNGSVQIAVPRLDIDPRVLARVSNLRGIAFDWIAKNLYVIYTPDRRNGGVCVINVRATESSIKNKLCPLKNLKVDNPTSLSLHPNRRVMLLTNSRENGTSSKLLLANMDGSNLTVLAIDRESDMHCVTIDYITNIAYWSESNDVSARVEAIRLDGLQRKTIISSENHNLKLTNPFSISVFMSRLYVSDKKNKEIWRVDAASGKAADLNQHFLPEALVKHVFVSNLLGLRIIHPLVQSIQYEANECAGSRCSHVCVLRPMGSRCLCPPNMHLMDNERTCVATTKETFNEVEGCQKPPAYSKRAFLIPATNNTIVKPGTILKYSCRKGWHIKDRLNVTSVSLTCTERGKWSLERPVCVKYVCSELKCGGRGACITSAVKGAVCHCPDHSWARICPDISSPPSQGKLPLLERGSGKVIALVVALLIICVASAFVFRLCLKKTNYSILNKYNWCSFCWKQDRGNIAVYQKRQEGHENPNYFHPQTSGIDLALTECEALDIHQKCEAKSKDSFTYRELKNAEKSQGANAEDHQTSNAVKEGIH